MIRISQFSLLLMSCAIVTGLVAGIVATPTQTATAMPTLLPNAVHAAVAGVNSKPANPPVEAGKVHWHKSTESAFAAAKTSKKPVLVFHMMGQLDHQFC